MVDSVKVDTVLEDQTDIVRKTVQRAVFAGGQLLADSGKVHWILDELRVVGQSESNIVDLTKTKRKNQNCGAKITRLEICEIKRQNKKILTGTKKGTACL